MNFQFRTSAFILLAMAAVLGRGQAWSQQFDWIGGTGNWSVPSNWYNYATNNAATTPPTASNLAVVGDVSFGTCTINQLGAACNSLYLVANQVSDDGYAPTAVQMTAGQLSTAQDEIITLATVPGQSFAGFAQSGGANLIGSALYLGYTYPPDIEGGGLYVLSGNGMLSAPAEYLGYPAAYGILAESGSFAQSGGINAVGNLVVAYGGSGSYTLSGNGLLNTSTSGSIIVGNSGSGYFAQTGGTVELGTNYSVSSPATSPIILGQYAGSSGTYTLGGSGLIFIPSLQAGPYLGYEAIGLSGSGTFIQTGGTNDQSDGQLTLGFNAGSSGSYSLGPGGLLLVGGPGGSGAGGDGLFGEIVGLAGSGVFTQTGGTANVGLLSVGFDAGSSGTYKLTGGSLYSDAEIVGGYGSLLGSGSFIQSGGTNSTPSLSIISSAEGTYSMHGGLLTTGELQVGFNASVSGDTFTQSAGTVQAGGGGSPGLVLDSSLGHPVATYSLSGGQVTVDEEYIGDNGTGSFLQYGGTHTVTGGLVVGGTTNLSSGTYSLQGGMLSTDTETVGNHDSGSFTQSGGTHAVSGALYLGYNPGASGSYNLSGAGQLNTSYYEYVGYQGKGSFTQSAGVNTVQVLYLADYANSGGTYSLGSGATLNNTNGEYVGYAGSASFTQSGGTNNAYYLTLGAASSALGSYTLSGGILNGEPGEDVGYAGGGTFVQSGGTNYAGQLSLAPFGGSGSYTLSAGLLNVYGLSRGTGTTSFSVGAATFQAGASFATSVPITLSPPGSTAVFDTSGYSLTLNGALTGSGGLQKISQGTLVLAASNGYTGPTTLTAGVLEAANGNSGSATGSNTVTLNGGVLAAGPAGGTIAGEVVAGSAPHTIAPGAALSSGYGTLNLGGGLATNNYTKLLFNLNLSSSSGTGSNGVKIYSGDLINFINGSALNIGGGQIAVVNTPTQTGDYPLFDDATLTGGTASLNNLTLPNQSGISYGLSTTVEPGYVDLVVGVGNMGASGGTWTYNGSGSWGNGTNWSGGLFPSSGTVTLGAPGGPIAVTLDGNRTAGALVFNGVNGYTLSQGTGGALTLGTTAGGSITVNNGSHTISAPLQMAGNLSIGVASGAALQLSGVVSESATGTSFTFNGPGTLNYSAIGTFTGNTTVNGGTLNLTGGYLPGGPSEYVNSTVVQTGGNNVVSPAGYYNALYVDHGATYTMSGGQLLVPAEWVSYDASAAFVQTGGTNSAANFLNIGAYASATYTLSGGLLSVGTEEVGAMGTPYSSTITQSGGTNLATTMYLGYGSPANYYLTSGTSGGGGLLSAQSEYLGIGNGSGFVSQSAGTNSASFLYAGYNRGAGEYVLSGSGLLSAAYEYFGYSSPYTSTMYQSGGTNTVAFYLTLGSNAGDSGAYNLSGGSLAVAALNGAEYIGYDGTGTFTQTGGTHTVGVPRYFGYNADGSGTYNQGAGSLFAASEYVGYSGSGTFTQTGGTHTVGTASPNFSFLFVGYNAGSNGTYNLGGGSLWCGGQEYIGSQGNGTFSQSGGYSTAAQIVLGSGVGSSGSYSLTFGNLSCQTAEIIGIDGIGSFTQGGGNNAPGWVLIGAGAGSGAYQLNDGQLSALYETVGYSGSGAFQQAGGSNVISTYALYMAAAPGSSGSYALSGGGYLSAPTEYIGYGGNATFTQTGGTNSAGTLVLAENGGTGTYNLGGGLLSLSNLYQGGGTPVFNFSGGTFQAASTFTTYLPISLSQSGSNGVFDTNGNTLTLNGALTGPGGLQKIGAGTLVLSGTDTYGGGTFVEDGTLIVTNNEGLADGSSLTVGDPSLFAPVLAGAAADDGKAAPEPPDLALLAGAVLLIALKAYRKTPWMRRRAAFSERRGAASTSPPVVFGQVS
jgi:fibronectin-binding autotransporter adhesin